jgi:hypothetical protein
MVLLLVPSHVQAQTSPITWTIVAGYNGTFKSGAWIPVTVTVANNGADLRGRLEWRWQAGGTRYSQMVDLPRGARKRIVLPVAGDNFGGPAIVTLYNGDTAVATEEQNRFNQVDYNSLVIGVASNASNALAEVAGISSPRGPSTTLVRLNQADVPERAELLQTFDILFLHDTDTTTWNDAQRTAVAQWIAGGGQLVVSGDRARTAAGIGGILPAEVKEANRPATLAQLAGKSGWKPRDPGASVRSLQLTPRAGAEVIATSEGGAPLLVRRSHGSGQVVQAAFDLQTLNVQGNAVPFWEWLLPRNPAPPAWGQIQFNGQGVLQQALTLPALRLLPLGSLLAFLALYIGLVGPANYLLLRRLDRREWAYVTIPLTVALFTAGAYGIGSAGRGGAATVTTLTVVQAAPGSTNGQALNYLGVFSPSRRSYQVAFEPETLVRDGTRVFGPGRSDLEIRRTEAAVEAPSFFVDVGSMRTLNAYHSAPAPDVRASLGRDAGGQATLEIENRSGEPLIDAAVLVGQNAQKLPDLQPGERRSVRLEQTGFIENLGLQSGGVIKRDQALRAIQNPFFGPDMGMMAPPPPAAVAQAVPFPTSTTVPPPPRQAAAGPIPTPTPAAEETVPPAPAPPAGPFPGQQMAAELPVTLVAWSGQPNLQVALDGSPARVQGDTLYQWPLGTIRP